ncbi:MAG: helix-turn-helix domain-containing protein [Methanomicrobiales archaeon]|nr:helix-turn-helix domain-containing protein [Methanomicrobiales archaeon]
MQNESVVVLDPTDERAQKVGKAIASPLASDILDRFSQGPMTLSSVSETLHVPINTAKYHIDNLLDADLLEVVNTKYSVKGREVKVYGLKNQILIVAPKRMDIKSVLMQYAPALGITCAISIVLAILQPILTIPGAEPKLLGAPAPTFPMDGGTIPEIAPMLSMYPLEAVIAFFLGGCLIVALAVAFDYLHRNRN